MITAFILRMLGIRNFSRDELQLIGCYTDTKTTARFEYALRDRLLGIPMSEWVYVDDKHGPGFMTLAANGEVILLHQWIKRGEATRDMALEIGREQVCRSYSTHLKHRVLTPVYRHICQMFQNEIAADKARQLQAVRAEEEARLERSRKECQTTLNLVPVNRAAA